MHPMNQEIIPSAMKHTVSFESVWRKLHEVGVMLQKQDFQLVILSMDRIIKPQMEIHYNIGVTLFQQGTPVWMGDDLDNSLQKSEWWYSLLKPVTHDDKVEHRRWTLKAAMLEVGFQENSKEFWRFLSKHKNTMALAEIQRKIDISGPFSVVMPPSID